jgi:hypothetical protein
MKGQKITNPYFIRLIYTHTHTHTHTTFVLHAHEQWIIDNKKRLID